MRRYMPRLWPWASDDPGGGNTPVRDEDAPDQSNKQYGYQSNELGATSLTDSVDMDIEEDDLVTCDDDGVFCVLDKELQERNQDTVTSCFLPLTVDRYTGVQDMLPIMDKPILATESQRPRYQVPQNTYWDVWMSRFRTRLGVDVVVQMEEGVENGSQRAQLSDQKEARRVGLTILEHETAPFNYRVCSLEKAVSTHASTRGYVGLYPHSADPPLQNTENIVPEYQQHQYQKTSVKLTAITSRPGRSEYSHQHSRLFRVHILSSFGHILLHLLLQSVHAVTSIFLRSRNYFEASHLVKRVFPVWQSTTDLGTKKYLHPPIVKMDHENDLLRDVDQTWLDEYINHDGPMIWGTGDYTSLPTDSMNYPPTEPLSLQQPYQILESTYSNPYNFPIVDSFSNNNHPLPTDIYHGMHFDTEMSSPPLSEEFWQYVRFPDSPAPAPATPDLGMAYSPGTTVPENMVTPRDVTPQTEGPNTPTFTLYSGRSPASTGSPQMPSSSSTEFICSEEGCGARQFERRCDLNKHLKTHNKDFQCEFSRPECTARFSTRKDLKRHLNTVHLREKKYFCKICQEQGSTGTFSRADNLKDHQRRVHKMHKR